MKISLTAKTHMLLMENFAKKQKALSTSSKDPALAALTNKANPPLCT